MSLNHLKYFTGLDLNIGCADIKASDVITQLGTACLSTVQTNSYVTSGILCGDITNSGTGQTGTGTNFSWLWSDFNTGICTITFTGVTIPSWVIFTGICTPYSANDVTLGASVASFSRPDNVTIQVQTYQPTGTGVTQNRPFQFVMFV